MNNTQVNVTSVWFKNKSGRLSIKHTCLDFVQLIICSLVISYSSFSTAAPVGGNIVGGSGAINQSGLTTNINQLSHSLAIDWASFNVNKNEIVNFLQPGSNAIALNRILGSNASQINGQINANGYVVLVNPNGLFFGADASVNVGGLIASGLDINPVDFMNGDYVFKSIDGTTGAVINGGILNASLGGSITLLGKQVVNEGLISANLGMVNLAVGKEAVLTFDSDGLLGVRISKAILQDELGVDPAILNSGEISAQGGRILLTASQSQDLFSSAVNTGKLQQATSVVVHEDGSFTLGGGADVVNTGLLDVSTTESNQAGGQVVVLGENISSSGRIKADAQNANGGNIELHSNDTTSLTESSATTARSENNGVGGKVKVLGNKAGLFDNSLVDASGSNGGGEVLIGGDQQGLNKNIRNATFIYLGENTKVKADASNNGNGGKIITFASDTARIYGDLFARGGLVAGNGGFIETSGLKGFEVLKTPDISALNGTHGEWLIDPNNIFIVTGGGNININNASPFVSSNDGASLGVNLITNALTGGATVTITTASAGAELGNITLAANIDYDGKGNNTLSLNALNDIIITTGRNIRDGNTGSGTDSLNINFNAGNNVSINDSSIDTNGGNFTATGTNFASTRGTDTTDTLDTSGGNVTLSFTGAIDIGSGINTGGGNFTANNAASFSNNTAGAKGAINTSDGTNAGNINITTAVIATGDIILGDMNVSGSAAGGNITATAGNSLTLARQFDFNATQSSALQLRANTDININAAIVDSAVGTVDTLDIQLNANNNGVGAGSVNVNANIATSGGKFTATGVAFNSSAASIDTDVGGSTTTGGHIDLNMSGAVTLGALTTNSNAVANGNLTIVSGGDITSTAKLNINGTTRITAGINNVSLNNTNNDFKGAVRIISAKNVTLEDSNTISLGHSEGASSIAVNLTVTAVNGITDSGVLNVGGVSTFKVTNANDDIVLNNLASTFAGVINLATAGTAGLGAITLNNNSDTRLGAVTSNGALSINSQGNLAINGAVTVNNNNGNDTTNSVLNFGLDNAAGRIFSLNSGGSITVNAGNGETTNVAINGANAGNNYNFNAGSNISLTNTGTGSSTLTVNGGSGVDTFNVAIVIPGIINAGGGADIINLNTATAAINDLRGGGGIDTLNGFAGTNLWTLSAANQGSVNSTGFQSIEALVGGAGVDTLTGPNQAVDWDIGAGSGNLAISGSNLLGSDFTGFENYTGGSGVDTFVVQAMGTFGVIDGGAGADTVDVSQRGSNILTLGIDIIGIETVKGNNINSTLIGTNGGDTWNITNINTGSVSGTAFSGFNNITGGTGNDTFQFDASGDILGTIDAGLGVDTVDYSNLAVVNIALSNAFNGVVNAEIIKGNNINSTLTADNINNTWSINGNNDGSVAGIIFTDFNNLSGGSMVDAFTMVSGGSIDGIISGGVGADTLDMSALTTVDVTLNTVAATSATRVTGIESIKGNNANSTLRGDNTVNAWSITGNNAGNVAGVGFTGFTDLVGGNADDNFVFGASTGISGLIDGGGNTAVGDSVNGFALTTFNVALGSDFNNIENFQGNNATSRLTATNSANTWNITGNNIGDVNGINFAGFANLNGGTNNDRFVFFDGGRITGLVDGNAVSSADVFDYSNRTIGLTISLSTFFTKSMNVEQIIGNNAASSNLTGQAGTSVWGITGTNAGTYSNGGDTVAFSNFTKLTGNTGADNFVLTGAGVFNGLLDGGVGADKYDASALAGPVIVNLGSDVTSIETITGNNSNSTIIGANSVNTWRATGANQGTVGVVSFFDFNNITGGANDDTFIFNSGASLSGTLDGGDHVTRDVVDVSAQIGFVQDLGSLTNIRVNIERFLGNNTDNGIIAENLVNSWALDGVNSGTITNSNGATEFVGFVDITGGDLNDDFVFANTGSIAGKINGGAGTNSINYAALTTVAVNLDSAAADGISNINSLIGNNTDSTLNGANVSNTWSIIGHNDGSVNGIAFTDFNVLNGGTQVDTFNVGNGSLGNQVSPDSDLSSGIYGGAGDDIFTVALDGSNNGSIKINGGSGNDGISFTGSNASYIEAYDSNVVAGFDRLSYTLAGNTLAVNYKEMASVQDSVTVAQLTVNGTTGNDTIQLNAGNVLGVDTFQVAAKTLVNYANKTNLTIDAQGGGADEIAISGDVTIAGTLTLNAETVSNASGSLITADTLQLASVNNAGQSGAMLRTDVATLGLQAVTGDTFIEEQNNIALAKIDTSGSLVLQALNGDITDSNDLTTTGNLRLNAQNGNIKLDNANQLSGELSLIASNDVTLNNTVNSQLNTVSAQSLNIRSNGITDTASSQITVSNSTVLDGGGQDIILDNNTHQFTNISVSNVNNVRLVDSNNAGLTINNIIAASVADITASGNVQLGRISAGNSASVRTLAAITDANGAAANMSANSVQLHAATGIGAGNAIDTVTASLDVVNTSSGNVDLNNTGVVTLVALKNLSSSGNITIANDSDYLINPGSIDAGYNNGELFMTTVNGSFLGNGTAPGFDNADITARAATFIGFAGTFGSFERPLVLKIRDSALIQTRASLNPLFAPPRPVVNDESLLQFSGISALTAITGEQLVEVESLGEVDSAIFTDLQNYSMEQVSIRLPRDQLFEDDLEKYDRL